MPGSTMRASLKALSSPVDRILSIASFTAATAAKGPIDGNGVRRQADAVQVGELLELGGDRWLVDDDRLLPLVWR
jgi:hypothetical protein